MKRTALFITLISFSVLFQQSILLAAPKAKAKKSKDFSLDDFLELDKKSLARHQKIKKRSKEIEAELDKRIITLEDEKADIQGNIRLQKGTFQEISERINYLTKQIKKLKELRTNVTENFQALTKKQQNELLSFHKTGEVPGLPDMVFITAEEAEAEVEIVVAKAKVKAKAKPQADVVKAEKKKKFVTANPFEDLPKKGKKKKQKQKQKQKKRKTKTTEKPKQKEKSKTSSHMDLSSDEILAISAAAEKKSKAEEIDKAKVKKQIEQKISALKKERQKIIDNYTKQPGSFDEINARIDYFTKKIKKLEELATLTLFEFGRLTLDEKKELEEFAEYNDIQIPEDEEVIIIEEEKAVSHAQEEKDEKGKKAKKKDSSIPKTLDPFAEVEAAKSKTKKEKKKKVKTIDPFEYEFITFDTPDYVAPKEKKAKAVKEIDWNTFQCDPYMQGLFIGMCDLIKLAMTADQKNALSKIGQYGSCGIDQLSKNKQFKEELTKLIQLTSESTQIKVMQHFLAIKTEIQKGKELDQVINELYKGNEEQKEKIKKFYLHLTYQYKDFRNKDLGGMRSDQFLEALNTRGNLNIPSFTSTDKKIFGHIQRYVYLGTHRAYIYRAMFNNIMKYQRRNKTRVASEDLSIAHSEYTRLMGPNGAVLEQQKSLLSLASEQLEEACHGNKADDSGAKDPNIQRIAGSVHSNIRSHSKSSVNSDGRYISIDLDLNLTKSKQQ